jgi:myo-inositol-1(or 4)-monophosphatase
MQHYKDFILEVLNEVSAIALRSFGKVSGTTKATDNNQVLTETDIEIGNKIVAAIKAKYPDHNIIDEEAGVVDNASTYTWVVDPIDGTSNFANGVSAYGIMIGLLEGQHLLRAVSLSQVSVRCTLPLKAVAHFVTVFPYTSLPTLTCSKH